MNLVIPSLYKEQYIKTCDKITFLCPENMHTGAAWAHTHTQTHLFLAFKRLHAYTVHLTPIF